jgi:two-component system OmpR family response regulator
MTSSSSSVNHTAGLSRRPAAGPLNRESREGQDQNNAMRVLVIEDDKETAQFLQ